MRNVAMPDQLDFFGAPEPLAPPEPTPEGFKYARDVLSREQEDALLAAVRTLPFKEFEFHGYVGKRRTISFGYSYDFGAERLNTAEDFPDFLRDLRTIAAQFSGIPAERFAQALVSEYGANAGIGWHRDKGVFGEIVGFSLLSPCRFRLRRRVGEAWERLSLEAEPRSAYLLTGPARTEWEHSIPEVEALRYSITLRTLR